MKLPINDKTIFIFSSVTCYILAKKKYYYERYL